MTKNLMIDTFCYRYLKEISIKNPTQRRGGAKSTKSNPKVKFI